MGPFTREKNFTTDLTCILRNLPGFQLGSVPGSWALAAATPPSLYSAWGWRGTPRDHRTAQFCGRFRLMRRDLSCFCGSGYSQHCPHRRVGIEQYNGHFVKCVIFIQ